MPHEREMTIESDHAAISDVVGVKEQSLFKRAVTSQPFWVTVALFILAAIMASIEPSFGTANNIGNVARNFAPFGIMALGMTIVIITGGIDLSVGSIMGLVAIVAGLFLTWEYPWYVAFAMGMVTGLLCGVGVLAAAAVFAIRNQLRLVWVTGSPRWPVPALSVAPKAATT